MDNMWTEGENHGKAAIFKPWRERLQNKPNLLTP